MSPEQLATLLGQAYHDAARRNYPLTTATCLFGVHFVDQLHECGVTAERLCELAGIPDHGPTINLGMRLSPHIKITNYQLIV